MRVATSYRSFDTSDTSAFRAFVIHCFGNNATSAWAYCFLTFMFTHSEALEIHGHSTNLIEVLVHLLKLVKSSSVTYHMVYPYT